MLDDHGGLLVGSVLRAHAVNFLFGLCGGHISPILIGAKAKGIRVVDVRHEATAVYAADAVARLTGIPGVAVVTAGPGLTNTITAVKNAQLARSPVLVLAGATATLLKDKGSLQDIDQLALMKPHVKWHASLKTVREIVPVLNTAFARARSGIPGPVFIEIPLDLQYPEDAVRELYASGLGNPKSLAGRLQRRYVAWHLNKLFAGKDLQRETTPRPPTHPRHTALQVAKAARIIAKAERPVLIAGSGAMMLPAEVKSLRQAVEAMGIPTYLSG
ncbi:MAG: thiamine pyrophosphate-binding protein, partial [Gammaproteobacteria bacterium]|nr:thiamine pyrophosphate-binding protein [Gammaproteobacteria bacterium]